MNMKPDMFLMKGGKMLLLKSGDMILMDGDVTMTDGTQVMTDGTIKLVDGTTLTLMEGEGMVTDSSVAAMNRHGCIKITAILFNPSGLAAIQTDFVLSCKLIFAYIGVYWRNF